MFTFDDTTPPLVPGVFVKKWRQIEPFGFGTRVFFPEKINAVNDTTTQELAQSLQKGLLQAFFEHFEKKNLRLKKFPLFQKLYVPELFI